MKRFWSCLGKMHVHLTTITKVALVLLLQTTLVQTILAETGDGHFWLKLQGKNIGMDGAVGHFGEWFNLPKGSTFELLSDKTDKLGIRHLRYRQYVRGCEVQASMVMVHGRDGIATSANGVVMEQAMQPDTKANSLASDGGTSEKLYLVETPDGYRYATMHYDAIQNADVYVDAQTGEVLKSVPHSSSISETTIQGRSMYSGTVPLSVTTLDDGTHVMRDETRHIYTVDAHKAKGNLSDYIAKDKDGNTIYDRKRYIEEQCSPFSTKDDFWTRRQLVEVTLKSFKIQPEVPFTVYLILRDYDGTAIDTSDVVYTSDLPLSMTLTKTGRKSAFYNIDSFGVEVWKKNYLGDDERLDNIGHEQLSEEEKAWSTDVTSGTFRTVETSDPAVDIHWGMQRTYDWYKNTLKRDSYDDKGGPIYNILYASATDYFLPMDNNNNAYASSSNVYNCYIMNYGIGDGVIMSPVVSLDVMAHEFTHLVTACTAGLEGATVKDKRRIAPESAALNESFSDIIGISVKKAVKGSKAKDNWLIGEEVMLQAPCMRDMSHRIKKDYPEPVYYKGKDWKDYADEHINCAVQNYWFYLLCEGEKEADEPNTGEDAIIGIGIDNAVKIAYRNLTQYLSPTSNYVDAYKGSLQAAADLYGEKSYEYSEVKNAWGAVGIDENTTPSAIRNVTAEAGTKTVDSTAWYNLQGQRINTPTLPGIYIHNGKKYIIK